MYYYSVARYVLFTFSGEVAPSVMLLLFEVIVNYLMMSFKHFRADYCILELIILEN